MFPEIRVWPPDEVEEIPKGWGKEVVICNQDGYAGKLLVYNAGGKSSMHYHLRKHETFYVLNGRFLLRHYDLETAFPLETYLVISDTVTIAPGTPHQLECIEPGTVIEFSTTDDPADNYRILPGDSQKASEDG